MAYTVTINFPKMPVRGGVFGSENKYQLILVFTVNAAGSNVTFTSQEKNLFLEDMGKPSWKYDLEDAILVPGEIQLRIMDAPVFGVSSYIEGVIFDTNTAKNFSVEIQIDGVTDFSGTALEETISYKKIGTGSGGVFSFSAAPSMALLNSTVVIDERSTPTDNFLYMNRAVTGNQISNVVNQKDGTLRVTHANIVAINNNDLVKISGVLGITDANGWHYVTKIDSTNFDIDVATVQNSYTADPGDAVGVYLNSDVVSLTTILEDIFKVVNSTITYAGGDISLKHNWIFADNGHVNQYGFAAVEMFTENFVVGDLLNMTGLTGLNSVKDFLKLFALHFCSFTGMIHEKKAFFHKLFHYDSADLQTLGTVLEYEKSYRFGLVDYVRAKTIQSDVVHYESGTFTPDVNRKIDIDNVVPFWYKAFGSSGSNVRSVTGSNTILEGNDDEITAISGTWHDNGELIAKFWFQNRGDADKSRTDIFKVNGVGYDFLKSFNHFGNKYQIIGLTKDYNQGTSEIEAIYLGAV